MATKAKGEVTAEKKLDIAMRADAELLRTVKQNQNLERDINKFGPNAKMAKYLRLHEVLTKEQLDVVLDLFCATSGAKKNADDDLSAELIDLLTQFDELADKVKEAKAVLVELTAAVALEQKKVNEMTTRLPSAYQHHQRIILAQKTLDGLENKLGTAMTQNGMLSTENRKLREEINHMLIERISFNKLWYSYIANLSKGKNIMMDIIEQATIAYDRRDEWIFRLNTLRSFAYNNLITQTEEMASLQKTMNHNKALEEFTAVKEQYRNMKALEAKKVLNRNQKRESMKKTIRYHKLVLSDIQAFTSVNLQTNATKFITNFTSVETENMAMFAYIADLHSQMEETAEELITLQENIVSQSSLNNRRAVLQNQTIKELKKSFGIAKKEADQEQSGLTSTNNILVKIYKNLEKLFKICKCSKAPFLELLGDNTTINNYNVLMHLQILEQRVNELLMNVYYKEKSAPNLKGIVSPTIIKEEPEKLRKYEVTEFMPSNPCPLCVDRELVNEVIDSLQITQTRDQVKSLLKERLKLPDGLKRLHNVSACNLPKSRQIIQRRYQ